MLNAVADDDPVVTGAFCFKERKLFRKVTTICMFPGRPPGFTTSSLTFLPTSTYGEHLRINSMDTSLPSNLHVAQLPEELREHSLCSFLHLMGVKSSILPMTFLSASTSGECLRINCTSASSPSTSTPTLSDSTSSPSHSFFSWETSPYPKSTSSPLDSSFSSDTSLSESMSSLLDSFVSLDASPSALLEVIELRNNEESLGKMGSENVPSFLKHHSSYDTPALLQIV